MGKQQLLGALQGGSTNQHQWGSELGRLELQMGSLEQDLPLPDLVQQLGGGPTDCRGSKDGLQAMEAEMGSLGVDDERRVVGDI